MKVKLNKKKKFVKQVEKAIETDELEIHRIVFLPKKATLRVICEKGLVFDMEMKEDDALAQALLEKAKEALG